MTVPALEWPHGLLDVGAIRAGGVSPVPFDVFVLKIHGRCNLACDYCYMYETADQSWRNRPKKMSAETLRWTVQRIAEHARAHDAGEIRVVLHGGEPLLAGAGFIARLSASLRAALPESTRLGLSIQTNAVLLDEDILRTLTEHRIRVGVSIDGNRTATDRHRSYADGRSSHPAVERNLALLRQAPFRGAYSGILAAVDLRNDPLATYEYLRSLHPPRLDFLLPHGTWSNPPPGLIPDSGRIRGEVTPYADWLLPIFDRWYAARPVTTVVRLFAEIIQVVIGGASALESVGTEKSAIVTIETDGAIRQHDALNIAYPGAAETGMNVREHAFDAALDHPGIVAQQLGRAGLSPTCQACPVGDICGGGLYAHRYRRGSGFLHPSVYCADLFQIVKHIRDRVNADVALLRAAARVTPAELRQDA